MAQLIPGGQSSLKHGHSLSHVIFPSSTKAMAEVHFPSTISSKFHWPLYEGQLLKSYSEIDGADDGGAEGTWETTTLVTGVGPTDGVALGSSEPFLDGVALGSSEPFLDGVALGSSEASLEGGDDGGGLFIKGHPIMLYKQNSHTSQPSGQSAFPLHSIWPLSIRACASVQTQESLFCGKLSPHVLLKSVSQWKA
jgi:hypothetical protein